MSCAQRFTGGAALCGAGMVLLPSAPAHSADSLSHR
jgi:hypothetical protein